MIATEFANLNNIGSIKKKWNGIRWKWFKRCVCLFSGLKNRNGMEISWFLYAVFLVHRSLVMEKTESLLCVRILTLVNVTYSEGVCCFFFFSLSKLGRCISAHNFTFSVFEFEQMNNNKEWSEKEYPSFRRHCQWLGLLDFDAPNNRSKM